MNDELVAQIRSFPVGEKFKYNDKFYVAIEPSNYDDACQQCAFHEPKSKTCVMRNACMSFKRKDKKSVVFRLYSKPKTRNMKEYRNEENDLELFCGCLGFNSCDIIDDNNREDVSRARIYIACALKDIFEYGNNDIANIMQRTRQTIRVWLMKCPCTSDYDEYKERLIDKIIKRAEK